MSGNSSSSPSCTEPGLDWTGLAAWLAERGHLLSLNSAPTRFPGGLANRNYLVEFDGYPAVLRCPPSGELPPGAYDMQREHSILKRLWQAFPLAPRGLYFCADSKVIGVPFQINEYRAGLVIHGDDLGALANHPAIGELLSQMMVSTLASLHEVSASRVGLESLGRPEGFVARNVAGWARRFVLASGNTPSKAGREVADWLSGHQVPDTRSPCLLHSDFKLDNLVLDSKTLAPVALLDWDMGTRGHPLMDLATLLSYWTQPGDPDCMHRLAQMPTAKVPFPDRANMVSRYASLMSADVSDYPFFRVLALFKLGVVFLQLYQLFLDGKAVNDRYREFGILGEELLEYSLITAREQCV